MVTRFDIALCSSVGAPDSSDSASDVNVSRCPCGVSRPDRPRPSSSHCASSARMRTHWLPDGAALPSSRDSVSRSFTSVSMRCDCCPISDR
ncbi:hypothetical protein D3C72_1858130 [compost metagenome]